MCGGLTRPVHIVTIILSRRGLHCVSLSSGKKLKVFETLQGIEGIEGILTPDFLL